MTEIEELQHSIDKIKQQLAGVQGQFESISRGIPKAQLSSPLDPISTSAIKSTIDYPVSIRLKNTDPQTAANYGMFFVSRGAYSITDIIEVHGTAGTDLSAVTLQIEKLTGTTAMGSGVAMLSTEFSLKAAINTTQYGILVTTGVTTVNVGDRLALKLTGTPTALKDLEVTVYLRPFGNS